MVIIDTDSKSVQFHPKNSIILEKWKGDISDRTLWELVPLLQSQFLTVCGIYIEFRGGSGELSIVHTSIVLLASICEWSILNDYS